MKNHDEQLLEQFFSGQLDEAGRGQLLQRLEEDSDLKKEFQWQQTVANAYKLTENRRIKSMLQASDKKDKPRTGLRIHYKNITAIAAAVVLLAAAVMFLRPSDPLFVPHDSEMLFRGNVESLTVEAGEAYKNEEYNKAALLYGQATANSEDGHKYQLLQGISLVGAKKYTQAIEVLTPLSKRTDIDTTPSLALWYLALAHFESGNTEDARRAAKAYLKRPDGKNYHKQAKSLLKKIN